MDLQKDFLNMQIAYEKNCAIRCNCSYEELKAQLDRSESLFGTRYLEGSPRHENWLLWVEAWQAAKAIPEGFVLVPKKSIEHWYLDEGESLWMDEPDNWLCDMDVGDVQEVEHKEYIVTESNTLYATKVWDGENQDVSSWEFFNSKDDAENAAEYCKAMIEAQEQSQ